MLKTAKAAKSVVTYGKEIYHFECLRNEVGDDQVIDNLRNHYKSTEGLSSADASIRAGQFIKDMDKLKAGEFGFKDMRALNSQEDDCIESEMIFAS